MVTIDQTPRQDEDKNWCLLEFTRIKPNREKLQPQWRCRRRTTQMKILGCASTVVFVLSFLLLTTSTASCFTAISTSVASFLPRSHLDVSYKKKRSSSLLYYAGLPPGGSDTQGNNVNANVDTKTTTTTTATPPLTTQSYLELFHSPTNTQIILVGCLHGSTSSAKDVEQLLYHSQPQTDVVVLELCPTRYKDLLKYMMIHRNNESTNSANSDSVGRSSNFVRMVSNKIETRGVSTGIAAAVLGGASGLSSALSGFEPGLEFITSIEYVQKRNNLLSSETNNEIGCDIILGDRLVDETLRRVGSLPKVSLGMWNNLRDKKWKWNETYYAEDATVLSDAVFGDRELRERQVGLQVDMRGVLTRNRDVVLDLLRLTLPSILLLQLITVVFTFSDAFFISAAGDSDNIVSLGNMDVNINMIADLSLSMSQTDWVHLATEIGMELLTSIVLIGIGYISLALPAVRVILSERDNQLVEAIEAACEVASEKQRDPSRSEETDQRARVVAVLGLLHVNGVAKKLIKKGC